jgi:hypothetical protein
MTARSDIFMFVINSSADSRDDDYAMMNDDGRRLRLAENIVWLTKLR